MNLLYLTLLFVGADNPYRVETNPFQIVQAAPAPDGFHVHWLDTGTWTRSQDLAAVKGDLGEQVAITGPGHYVYARLASPTLKQVQAALATAQAEWKAVKAGPAPFEEHPPRHADGSSMLPVGSVEALDEVNAKRASMGLRPFARDDGLTIGAAKCAAYLAARLMSDHTSNDFAFLPDGSRASAGGLGVADTSWGWISCCYRENWTTAGAAFVVGSDGRRYMYIFVK